MCDNEYESLEQAVNDVETFQYSHETSTKHVLVQGVYVDSASPLIADIQTQPYSMLTYMDDGMMTGTYDNTHDIPIYIDNGSTLNIMPTHFYDNAYYLHHLPKAPMAAKTIQTGNGPVKTYFWIDILFNVQGCMIQFKLLVCDTQAQTGILLSKMALEQLQTWQDYSSNTLYVKQTAIPLHAIQNIELLRDRKTTIEVIADRTNELQYKDLIEGQGIVWVWSNDSSKPLQPIVATFHNDKTLITFENTTGQMQYISKGAKVTVLDMRSKDGGMTNFEWDIPTDDEGNLVLYAHTFASSLEPTKLANEDPVLQAETKLTVSQTPNKHTVQTDNTEDPYPWLDLDDPRCKMTDEEILRLKVPFDKSILTAAEKERLIKLMLENTAAFSIRDKIGTCPYLEVKLKLRDDKPFFVRPYNICEDQKPIIQKEMDRLEKLGIIRKGLTGYSSPVLLVKRKQQNLYRVVTYFRVLNERLVRVNHAFPIAKTRCNYDRQVKHKPVDRYELPKITKKTNKAAAVAKVNECQYVATLQEILIKSLTRNETPLKKLERIDKPLTIKQDQEEKQVVNTIREVPPEMYTPAHLLIPPQDKLSLFRKHIPKQQEIDALLKNLRKRVIHNLMVNLDTKDLIESYTKSLRYHEIYNYIADGRLPGNVITQKKISGEAANYVVVNGLLFKIAQHKESGKWTHYLLLVIPEKFEANILNMYHNSLLAMHQGPYRTFLTMRKQFYFPNMLPKIQKYIEACTLCQRTKPKNTKQRSYYSRIPTEYIPCENLAVDLKKMPMGIIYHEYLLIATCEKTNFVHTIPMQNRQTEMIANALLHRVCCLTGPPTKLSIDQDSALTSQVIKELLTSLECTMQIISPWNHGSSKAERQIQMIGNMINKHLTQKGASWPLYAAVSAYAMNTFASTTLQGLSPFELVFTRKP